MSIRRTFFILLAIVLILGVLVSRMAPYCSAIVTTSLCETEENELEDDLEDRFEVQFDCMEYHVVFAWHELTAGHHATVWPRPLQASAISASCLSSGWLLPLRI